MDYFKILCLDLITKKINPSIVTAWDTYKHASISDNGVYRQQVIGGDEAKIIIF
jgi:hypothetical protein